MIVVCVKIHPSGAGRMMASLLYLMPLAMAAAPDKTDYCEFLGADDIQGKKSGFLAGNKVCASSAGFDRRIPLRAPLPSPAPTG